MGFAFSFAVETSIKVVKCCYGFEEGNEDLERAKKKCKISYHSFEVSAIYRFVTWLRFSLYCVNF